tara:strand:+ start:3921 stop:4616 length:696 start_codon:yes stop_codon:yes gene_type:complete
MIQILIIVLFLTILIYVAYVGAVKSQRIQPIDLYKDKYIKSMQDLLGLDTSQVAMNYKSYTHAFWLRTYIPESGYILKHDDSGSVENLLIKLDQYDNTLEISLGNGLINITRPNMPLQRWNHVACIMDRDTFDVYINGKLYETRQVLPEAMNTSTWGNIHFGAAGLPNDTTLHFSEHNVKLSGYRYFPYAYTENQIKALYKNEYPLYYNNEEILELNIELGKNGSSVDFVI